MATQSPQLAPADVPPAAPADARWPMMAFLGIAFAMGQAAFYAKGRYEPISIMWIALASLGSLLALFAHRLRLKDASAYLLPTLLFAALLIQARELLIAFQGETPERKFAWTQCVVILVAIAAASWNAPRISGLFRIGVVLCVAIMGMSVIVPWNPPKIDVITFQDEGCRLILGAQNPYSHQMPDIYGVSLHSYYGGRPAQNGHVATGYCYPPLSLFLSLPGYLLGDIRYAQLLCIAVVAGALMALRSKAAMLAAVLFATWPALDFVLEHGWTDLYAAPLIALVVYIAARHPRSWLLPVFLGLLLSVKQHLFLILPLTAMIVPDGFTWRRWWVLLWKSALVACLINVPFILVNPPAWYDSVIRFHLGTPFRFDSISLSNWLRVTWRLDLPDVTGFAAFAAYCALALWLMPRKPAFFAAAAGGAYLFFFAWGKQAFANYYYFASTWMLCALAAIEPPATPHPAGETE